MAKHPVMKVGEWSDEFDRQAFREGWSLFTVSGDGPEYYGIQRVDDPPMWNYWEEGMPEEPIFESDDDALLFVIKESVKRKPHAMFAIKWHGVKVK